MIPSFSAAAARAIALLALAGSYPQAASAQQSRQMPAIAAATKLPETSFAPMLARVIPAVVTIRVRGRKPSPIELPPRGSDGSSLMTTPASEPFGAGGSGIVFDPAMGYILTNNHVIEGADQIEVGLADGRRMTAKLIGTDPGTDIAVIKVEERKLPSIAIGDSDVVRVGDIVAAVGNPFGLEGTASLGIVSATMRTEIGHGAFEDYLQIDAQINPGNSGGALVNIKGQLIGINTVAGGGQGQNVGIGFAVPINMAKGVAGELIKAGRTRRGSTGLIVEDLPMRAVMANGNVVLRGAAIKTVLPGSPAAKAGLEPGDIVTSVANKPVRSAAEFVTRTVTVPLGTEIPMSVLVKGKQRSVSLTSAEIAIAPEEVALKAEHGRLAGAVVGDITLGNPLYGEVRGAQVLRLPADAPAFAAGLSVGDVIVGIDSAKVRSPGELTYRIERAGLQYRVIISRNGMPGWIRGGQ